jgi:hypothetical protein
MLLFLLAVDLFKSFAVLHLLFNIVLVLFDFSLGANLLVCHLPVELKLEKSLAFICTLLSQLLLFIVEESVEFHYCVPFVILRSPGLTYLGEHFNFVTNTRRCGA